MATVRREHTEPRSHCAYCGQPIAHDAAVVERFGERFCSEGHADEFAAGVRAARVEAAARQHPAETTPDARPRRPRALGIWVAAAAMIAVLWFAFTWDWGRGAAVPIGGTLLTVLLLLACPLAMYFMMRGMGGMGGGGHSRHGDGRPGRDRNEDDGVR